MQDFFNTPFFWGCLVGLLVGFVFVTMLFTRLLGARGEVKRLKRHLGEKLELEAEATGKLRQELESLRKQNEHLRLKVSELNQSPDRRMQRDLEIYARAEKIMISSSPGFPAVWEEAKNTAAGEIADEESGKSLPRRVFSRLLPGKKEEHLLKDQGQE